MRVPSAGRATVWLGKFEPERIVMEGFDEGFVDRLPGIQKQLEKPDLDSRKRYLMEVSLGIGLMEAGRMREADAIARRLRPRPPLRWGRTRTRSCSPAWW